MQTSITVRRLLRLPSAWLPLLASLLAVADLGLFLVSHGVVRGPQHDEGAAARVWQLLMAGQLPVVGWFAVRWLPAAPRPALVVLSLQLAAVLASAVPIFLLEY